jgi:hypothetical protein
LINNLAPLKNALQKFISRSLILLSLSCPKHALIALRTGSDIQDKISDKVEDTKSKSILATYADDKALLCKNVKEFKSRL